MFLTNAKIIALLLTYYVHNMQLQIAFLGGMVCPYTSNPMNYVVL